MMMMSMLGPVAVFLLVLGPRPDLVLPWSNPVVPFKTILPLLTALAFWVWAFATGARSTRFAEVGAFSLEECLGSILMLSVVPVTVMFRLVRQGAVTSPTFSGALVGLAAASGVTTDYCVFCTCDTPLFFVNWYGVAILIVTLISAALGSRTLAGSFCHSRFEVWRWKTATYLINKTYHENVWPIQHSRNPSPNIGPKAMGMVFPPPCESAKISPVVVAINKTTGRVCQPSHAPAAAKSFASPSPSPSVPLRRK
jgi:hypothetical protein